MRAGHVVALILLAGCLGETQVTHYPSVTAARADGVFLRGWVPDVLPDDGGPIVEVHDLDTNAVCCRADFKPEAATQVAELLLAAGFRPCEREIAPPPLASCPFAKEDVAAPPQPQCRIGGEGRGREFAVVRARGVLYFWSGQT